MDKRDSLELLVYILKSIELIEDRFKNINSQDDFLKDNMGIEKLDAISMRLQTIGEAIKNILKRDADILLKQADKSYWSEIVRFRDVISHHYIDIDAEVIFDICKGDLKELKMFIAKAEKNLKDNNATK